MYKKEVAVRDTTVKRVTTRGGHNIPGEVAPGTPKNCRDCEIALVSRASMVSETHAHHRGRGYCSTCYFRRNRAGVWDGPPPRQTQWRAVDLVAEYEFLRDNYGFDRKQAAAKLGVQRGSLDTAIFRVRRYAERDKLRAEIAAAEAEAHRINDDMIAYAIRKAVAA